MNRVNVNTNELNALQGLPHCCYAIYLHLKSWMDGETGLVGSKKRRISWQALIEHLYIEPKRGLSEDNCMAKGKLRHIVTQVMVKAGLLEHASSITNAKGYLIFYLPLAKGDNYTQNKLRTISAPFPRTGKSNENKLENNDISPAAQQKLHSTQNANLHIPLNNINNNSLYRRVANEKSPISANFQPTAQLLAKAKQLDCCPDDLELELQKFIAYQQSTARISADWNAEFLRWLLNGKQYRLHNPQGSRYHGQHQTRANRKTHKQTAVETVLRANAEYFQTNDQQIKNNDQQTRHCLALDTDDSGLWS